MAGVSAMWPDVCGVKEYSKIIVEFRKTNFMIWVNILNINQKGGIKQQE